MENKEENKKAEPKFYHLVVTQKKQADNKTGVVPEGRDVLFEAYAYDGELPEDYVDLGEYWEYGSGELVIYTKDRKELMSLERALDCISAGVMASGMEFINRMRDLKGVGSWMEIPDLTGGGSAFRDRRLVVKVVDRPELSIELTKRASDLNTMEKYRIRINGVRMFRNGDVSGRVILNTNLPGLISVMWENYILERTGVSVKVGVEVPASAEGDVARNLHVIAANRWELNKALKAIGVCEDVVIEPDCVSGDGPGENRAEAFVSISEIIR